MHIRSRRGEEAARHLACAAAPGFIVIAAFFAPNAWSQAEAADAPYTGQYDFSGQTALAYAGAEPAPLELLGFDFEQSGVTATDYPRIAVGRPYRTTLYWKLLDTAIVHPSVRIEFQGSGPPIAFEHPIEWPGEPRIGDVLTVSFIERLPWLAYSGHALMRVTLTWEFDGRDAPSSVFLGARRCYIEPAPQQSTLSDADVRKEFGPEWVRLNQAFRLGRCAEIEVPLPDAFHSPIAAIGVISATAFENALQTGEVVAEIGCTVDDEPIAPSIPIIYGRHTFQTDADLYAPGAARRSGVRILLSQPSDRLDARGMALERHVYAGTFELETAIRPDAFSFRMVPEGGPAVSVLEGGVLDVREIVVLPAAGGARGIPRR